MVTLQSFPTGKTYSIQNLLWKASRFRAEVRQSARRFFHQFLTQEGVGAVPCARPGQGEWGEMRSHKEAIAHSIELN